MWGGFHAVWAYCDIVVGGEFLCESPTDIAWWSTATLIPSELASGIPPEVHLFVIVIDVVVETQL